MKNRTLTLGAASALALTCTCLAGMTGVCASVRQVGGYTLVDMYATIDNPNHRLASVRTRTLLTDSAGGFVQGGSPGQKGWGPDALLSSTPDSLDSFLTIGQTDFGDPSGAIFANPGTLPAGWAGGSWIGTPLSAPSNEITGTLDRAWAVYGSDVNNRRVSLAGLQGRIDVHGDAAGEEFGVWFAHLVLVGTGPAQVTFGGWGAQWFGGLGPSGTGDYRSSPLDLSFTVPAPGVAALVLAGGSTWPVRRRRRGDLSTRATRIP